MLLARALSLLWLAALTAQATTHESPELKSEVAALRASLAPKIEAAQARFSIPGLAVVLVRPSEVLWQEGFGYANLETKAAVTPATIFRAGSLAKPFTALAVMQLADEGAIDIDQPILGYLPELGIRSRFDRAGTPITVRAIMNHHGGLPTDLNKGMWTHAPFTGVAAALAEEYTAFPPGLVYSYSNIGYSLLGHMIQQVADEPFAERVRRRIFDPLAMTSTSLSSLPPAEGPVAQGYRDGIPFQALPIRDVPALGLNTSAHDLGRFMRAWLSGGELDGSSCTLSATLEEMIEPQNTDVPLDMAVTTGLGWMLESAGNLPGCGRVIRHGGTTLAFAAEMILLPEDGLGVAVLANADGSRSVVKRLAEAILSQLQQRAPEPHVPQLFAANAGKEAAEAEPMEADGQFATGLGLLAIRSEDATLCNCVTDETANLIPYPNGWIGLDTDSPLPPSLRPLAKARFKTSRVDGREVVIADTGERQLVLGERVPEEPIPKTWLDRIGRYDLVNPDPEFPVTDAEIKLNDGQLCMAYRLPVLSPKLIQVPLRAISDDEAIVVGLGRSRGETVRAIGEDDAAAVRFSGFVGKRAGPVAAPPVKNILAE